MAVSEEIIGIQQALIITQNRVSGISTIPETLLSANPDGRRHPPPRPVPSRNAHTDTKKIFRLDLLFDTAYNIAILVKYVSAACDFFVEYAHIIVFCSSFPA